MATNENESVRVVDDECMGLLDELGKLGVCFGVIGKEIRDYACFLKMFDSEVLFTHISMNECNVKAEDIKEAIAILRQSLCIVIDYRSWGIMNCFNEEMNEIARNWRDNLKENFPKPLPGWIEYSF